MKNALNFLKSLVRNGEYNNRVFLAGGAVRDMEMGLEPKDLDVVVTGPLTSGMDFAVWATKKMGNYKEGSNPVVFPVFGTAKFVLVGEFEGENVSGVEIESVATRKEKYSDGSRKPEVSQGELMDDVLRRDFTVNSLLLNLTTDEVLDLTGLGRLDIRDGLIRTTSEPDVIFSEDPLRMLRAIRFAAKYKWTLAFGIRDSIVKNGKKLITISCERIRDEFNKMLLTNSPEIAINELMTLGLLPHVVPELRDCLWVKQNSFHDEDVFDHLVTVTKNTQPVLIQRLTAIFHDIGKPATKTEDETGIHFYSHEEKSAELAETIMRRLKYSNEEISSVVLGVRNHMRLKSSGEYGEKMTDKALRKFCLTMGAGLEDLLDVIHSDNLAHSEGNKLPNQIPAIRERIKNLKMPVTKPILPVTGEDLIELGLKPGPIFTTLLKLVEEAWLENPLLTKEEALGLVRERLCLTGVSGFVKLIP